MKLESLHSLYIHGLSGYGTARACAEKLGGEEDAALLAETLEEESSADDELSGIATMLQSQCNVGSDDSPGSESDRRRLARQPAGKKWRHANRPALFPMP